jgi:hypothetical protein
MRCRNHRLTACSHFSDSTGRVNIAITDTYAELDQALAAQVAAEMG